MEPYELQPILLYLSESDKLSLLKHQSDLMSTSLTRTNTLSIDATATIETEKEKIRKACEKDMHICDGAVTDPATGKGQIAKTVDECVSLCLRAPRPASEINSYRQVSPAYTRFGKTRQEIQDWLINGNIPTNTLTGPIIDNKPPIDPARKPVRGGWGYYRSGQQYWWPPKPPEEDMIACDAASNDAAAFACCVETVNNWEAANPFINLHDTCIGTPDQPPVLNTPWPKEADCEWMRTWWWSDEGQAYIRQLREMYDRLMQECRVKYLGPGGGDGDRPRNPPPILTIISYPHNGRGNDIPYTG